MTMISVVMIIAFTTIYVSTVSSTQRQNKLKLENVSSTIMNYMGNFARGTIINALHPAGTYLQAFGVVVNEKREVVFESSFGTMPQSFLLKAIEKVAKQNKVDGKIHLEGKQLQYVFSQQSAAVKLDEVSNTTVVEQLYTIAFLDVTESEHTLRQLLSAFIGIGILTLMAILGISIYFAKRAVIPIEKSYRKQQQFIQDASHELKTPLAAISTNLAVVTSNAMETVEMQGKWLGVIGYEVERMSKLVNDLLYLAKTDHIDNAVACYPVNFTEILEYAMLSVETVGFEKGILFKEAIQPDVIVNGDKDQIEQVVKILLDNALKYTNTGGGIEVELKYEKNQGVLSIANTGVGIPKEHIDKIFDRFYRVDASRKHNGSYGLGLSIAKSLVESMQGSITVSSVENVETVFRVTFNGI